MPTCAAKEIHKLHKYLSEKGWIRNPDLASPKSCGRDRILLWIHNTACEKSKNLFRSIRSLLICVYEGSDEDEDDDGDGDNEKDGQPTEGDDEQNEEDDVQNDEDEEQNDEDDEQNDEDEEQNDEGDEQNDEDEGWSPLNQE